MITLLFIILMLTVCGKLTAFALKTTWGITKFICTVILFPAIMIGLALSGFVAFAIPILIVAGIVLIIKSAATV